MSQYIYKPSAFRPFRYLAEDFRKQAIELRKLAKPYHESTPEYHRLIGRAVALDECGKQLKALASDMLNDRIGVVL